ncbi:MAG: hypothetical protein HY517_00760 [Candidatus Aenigmarchaeota archaeon]|nr:hypothetical protein [Candidatus Aenigmarchaeota archaeon]
MTDVVEDRFVKIPAFTYKDNAFPETELSRDIEYLGTGERARILGPKSITLGYQAALFEIGLLAKLGCDAGVPDEVRDAALQHYETITSQRNRGKGNWNNTVFDYMTDFGQPSNWRRLNGYERIGIINQHEWVQENDIWTPKGEPIITDAPPEGFALLTMDGLYQPTGVAFETGPRDEAVRRLAAFASRNGLEDKAAKEFGKNNASYSYRRKKGSRYSPASRVFDLDDYGPFCVYAGWLADGGGRVLGAFPSRSSEKD